MYLKSVEITGFKSFADRLRLELKPGITGIVGPNGCGKSNVVESIRWCMGEGSWKSLRSQSMADVIFGGTTKRQPLSMAEVTLTFDNTQPLLPVDFTEVTVTRKIYRSGESEYYLNKVQCRRKDIQELFLDTGIGEEGYSIIDQGKVEFVLNSKPEDRRVLFEEAAGVSKFRAKRHEATLKLDRVELDMSRLNDTLAMILDQIKKLDSAARKARQYQKLKEQLAGMEVAGLVIELDQLDGQIAAEEEQLKPLRDRAESLSSTLDAAEAELATLNLNKASAENEVMQGAAKVSKVKEELARMEERLKAAEHKLEEAVRRETVAAAALADADEKLSKPDPEILRLKEELEVFARELEAAKAEAAAFETELKAELEAWRAVEAEAAEADQRFFAASQRVIEAQRLAAEAQGKVAHLQADLRSIQKDTERNAARRAEKESGLSGVREQALQAADAFQKAGKLLEVAELRREWLQNAREQVGRRLGQAREKLAEAQARFETAKSAPQPYSGSAAQTVIEARLPGVVGRVSELLRPEAPAAGALREALGERWNAVVCRGFADAQAAIELLDHNGAGRCRFLVLESLPLDAQPASELPLNARRLLDMVHVDAEHARLAEFLLKDTFVSGRSVHGRHWIIGGSEDPTAPAALPDLGELSAHASDARRDEAALAEEEKTIAAELSTVETQCRTLRAAASEADKTAHVAEVALKNAEGDLVYLTQEAELLTRQYSEGEALQSTAAEEHGRLLAEHDALNTEQQALKAATDALRAKRDAQKDAYHNKQLRGAELNGHVHKAEGAIATTRSSIERREADRRALEADRARFAQDIETAKELQADASELKEEIGHEIGRWNQDLAAEEAAYKALMEALEAARAACETKAVAIRELHAEVDEVREQVHSGDIRLGQKKSQREAVTGRLASDWQLTVEDARAKASGQETSAEEIANLRRRLESMGPINMAAPEEYAELEQRHTFLKTQIEDLTKAREDLKAAIQKINATTRENFRQTYEEVRAQFKRLYGVLFEGGEADLVLTNPDDLLESGIDVIAQPPGKKLISISLMSGGEKAMTSAALLFSFFMVRPSPFCMLDEVDAALDEANVERFVKLLKEFAQKSQFLIISHNKRTMEVADVIYGVTMAEQGVSQMLSVELNKPGAKPAKESDKKEESAQ